MPPVDQPLRTVVYERIRAAILTGDLEPGAALSEADQAVQLGCSRTPVREAFQRLSREGLVEIAPKRGTFVAQLSLAKAREAFEFREAIEVPCARLAAIRRTPEQLERMRAALPGEGGDSYEGGLAFHGLVAEAASNSYLLNAFHSASATVALASRVAARSAPEHAPASHAPILEAIEAGDADGAEAAMRTHIRNHYERLVKAMTDMAAAPARAA